MPESGGPPFGSPGPPTPVPVSLARLRAALEAAGAPPRRRHGQHFLLDDNLLAAIVRDAGVGPRDVVLEVGPGPGLLTRHLLATGAKVVAIEIDRRVGAAARSLIEPEGQARLRWIEADALAGPRQLGPELQAMLGDCTVSVSNLPYNAASPLLAGLLTAPRGPRRIVALVQAEHAARFLAGPGTGDYGPLAVQAALCAQGKVLRSVPAQAFWPRPRVESCVLAFELLAERPSAERLDALAAFLRVAFRSRRKALLGVLATATGLSGAELRESLTRKGHSVENLEKLRAEALSPVELSGLALWWACHAAGERQRP